VDLAQLAQTIAAFLSPFLPYLLKAGEKAAEEAGKKFGCDAWERAKALWGKLRPKVEAKPAAQEAAQDVAKAPADADAQAALRLQLRKLLAEDEALTAEVARLWEEAKAVGIAAIASGERSAAAQKIESSTIVTGDQSLVQQGKYSVNIGEARGVALGNQAQVDVNVEGAKPPILGGETNPERSTGKTAGQPVEQP